MDEQTFGVLVAVSFFVPFVAVTLWLFWGDTTMLAVSLVTAVAFTAGGYVYAKLVYRRQRPGAA